MRRSSTSTSVLIVGGGHAGLSLAACLGTAGIDVIVLERSKAATKTDPRMDGRTLALSFRSMRVLRQGGVWPLMEKDSCPIHAIRVADQDSRHHLDFHHDEVGDKPFGWIIENPLFNQALARRATSLKNVTLVHDATVQDITRDTQKATVTLEDGRTFDAALVIGADGRKSLCRELAHIPLYGWSYQQTAIVCTLAHSLPHDHVAVEHFQPGGPFATLPMTDRKKGKIRHRSSIVWTEKTEVAQHLMAMDEDTFTARLQEKVEGWLGSIERTGARFAYPLTLQHAETYTGERLALVGDAAHGIHPIAGQGFNLGMGDIEDLAHKLIHAFHLGLDLGDPDILRRYEKKRRFDNGNMILVTDGLVKLFSNAIPPVQIARRLGLSAVQHMPRLRRFFMRSAMGIKAA